MEKREKKNKNNLLLTGRIVRDPSIRQAGSKEVMVSSICYDEAYKGKDGVWVNTPYFFDIEMWAPFSEDHIQLQKGDFVEVEGPVKQKEYVTKNGEQRRQLMISVFKLTPISKKTSSSFEEDVPF